MEEKSPLDFSVPQRQSSIAIGIILIKFIRTTIRAFWPILVSFFIGTRSSSSFEDFIGYIAIGFAAFNLIGSVLTYFRYYFHIEDNAVIIDKGVLKRTHTNIPFDRIQTINFKQNIIHQIFGVISVEIDTAGAGKSEISIDALKHEQAHALRDFIMAEKQQLEQEAAAEGTQVEEEPAQEYERILHLNPTDLLKVGVSQNHLRSMGLIFAFVFTIINQVSDDWTGLVADGVEEYQGYLYESNAFIFAIMVIFVLVISFIFS